MMRLRNYEPYHRHSAPSPNLHASLDGGRCLPRCLLQLTGRTTQIRPGHGTALLLATHRLSSTRAENAVNDPPIQKKVDMRNQKRGSTGDQKRKPESLPTRGSSLAAIYSAISNRDIESSVPYRTTSRWTLHHHRDEQRKTQLLIYSSNADISQREIRAKNSSISRLMV